MSGNDQKIDKGVAQDSGDNADLTETISCDVCLKEIPPSVAKSLEGSELMVNFCGIECHDKWIHQEQDKNNKKSGSDKKE